MRLTRRLIIGAATLAAHVAWAGPFDDLQALYAVMPMVHCHCFTRELDRDAAERDIRQVRVNAVS